MPESGVRRAPHSALHREARASARFLFRSPDRRPSAPGSLFGHSSPALMASGKFLVEIGRVVLINNGSDAGKIATIVDFIDQNRVLIDGPSSGVVRRAESFKNIQLTRFVLNFPHGANSNFIQKLWDAEDINTKFAATPKAKQLAAKSRRAALTDFERFKLYKTKQKVNRIVKAIYNRLQATQRKEKAKKRPKVEKKPRTARNKKVKAKRLAKKEAAKKA